MDRESIRVLLIEDNPGDRRIVQEVLSEVGGVIFELNYAEWLSTGLEQLAEGDIDVVLLDLGLPDSQGLATLDQVREHSPKVPIVVMTGLDDEDMALKALQRDAQDYQIKGQMDSNMLSRVIRYAIERKRAEEELKKHREHLEELVEQRTRELRDAQEELVRKEKLAILGQLAGGVSHELRNPLGAIKNATYFLNMVLEEAEPEVKETLEILEKEVATSDKIISSLLDFARPKPTIQVEVDVNAVIQETLLRNPVPENVEVVHQLNGKLPTVLADPDQLTQVFGNIILNAIQAMPEGGCLSIKSEVLGSEWVAVSLTDTGVGISEGNLRKVFEPLFTTKAKGIGLGLAIIKNLMEKIGGTIEVQSEVGKGSTFTIKLPQRKEETE